MAINRQGSFDNYLVTEKYLSIRNTALHFPAKSLGKYSGNTVYGLVIDIPMNATLLSTLVVYANGACNLYFNNGAEYVGAALRHQTVIQPSRLLVANSAPLLADAMRAKAFPLPMGRQHFVHMLTKKGVFKRVIDPFTIQQDRKEAQTVYVLYQQLMQVMRSAQIKDQSEKAAAEHNK
jgi:hypothetical protein